MSGQIIVAVTADHLTARAVRTITLQDFSVSGFQIQGTRSTTNQGLNASNQMYWTITTSATVTDPDGQSTTWSANRTRTILAGLDTPSDYQDDSFQIQGTTSGTTPQGESFSSNITVPLVKDMDCPWPIRGVEELYLGDRKSPRSIDFGSGACDDQATVTFPDGDTYDVTLSLSSR